MRCKGEDVFCKMKANRALKARWTDHWTWIEGRHGKQQKADPWCEDSWSCEPDTSPCQSRAGPQHRFCLKVSINNQQFCPESLLKSNIKLICVISSNWWIINISKSTQFFHQETYYWKNSGFVRLNGHLIFSTGLFSVLSLGWMLKILPLLKRSIQNEIKASI